MRTPIEWDSGPSSATRDHLCLGYLRRDDFVAEARKFLAGGLTAGERVFYVAPGDPRSLAEELRAAGSFDKELRDDALQVVSLDSAYTTGTVVDPAAQVRLYAAATAEALDAGFTGLRVAAEVTQLVRTPAQLDAFARYEHLVDRFMATHPMSAMCSYDRGELGDDVIAQLACMHPCAHAGATPFHLHGHARCGSTAALDGELDVVVHELWPLALERADLQVVSGVVAIDAGELKFIDHRNLLAVADYAERNDTTVVLRTRLSTPARLVELFGLKSVRVEHI